MRLTVRGMPGTWHVGGEGVLIAVAVVGWVAGCLHMVCSELLQQQLAASGIGSQQHEWGWIDWDPSRSFMDGSRRTPEDASIARARRQPPSNGKEERQSIPSPWLFWHPAGLLLNLVRACSICEWLACAFELDSNRCNIGCFLHVSASVSWQS